MLRPVKTGGWLTDVSWSNAGRSGLGGGFLEAWRGGSGGLGIPDSRFRKGRGRSGRLFLPDVVEGGEFVGEGVGVIAVMALAGLVEVADGVEAACTKAFWRDYPESPEWKTFPRGYYSGDEATANSVDKCVWDPVHFSGSGVIRIVQDECIDTTLMILR